jgi:nucleotide-binding universal stress UspA family protein
MEKIIVGMDQSDSAAAALRWAVREGDQRGWPVMALLAWGHLDHHLLDDADGVDHLYDEETARKTLDEAVARAVGAGVATTVETTVVHETPAEALIDAAAEASLLVVGARGMGGFKSLLLGSVSNKCVHRASCPVVVVRAGADQAPRWTERILVGVDGSDAANCALGWALDAARAHRIETEVEVLYAWRSAAITSAAAPVVLAWDPLQEAAQHTLGTAVDAANTDGLDVRRTLVFDAPAHAILDAAGDADLVVISSRGRGNVRGMLLGSVSQQVIHHAPCPVVVVPSHHSQS